MIYLLRIRRNSIVTKVGISIANSREDTADACGRIFQLHQEDTCAVIVLSLALVKTLLVSCATAMTPIFPALRAMIIIMITAYAEHLSQTRNSEQSFVEVIGHIRHGAMSTLMIPGSLQLYVRLIGRKGQLSSSRGPIPP